MTSLRFNTLADVRFRAAIDTMLMGMIADPSQVAMVMRWDRNDARVWNYRSLPNGQTVVPGGGACHAEEVMMASWAQCCSENGGRLPASVEILLTMSPCLDRSQERNFLGATWPRGCTQKLVEFIRTEPDTNAWSICFFNAYQEDTHIAAQSGGAIALLGGVHGVDMYQFKERHSGLV